MSNDKKTNLNHVETTATVTTARHEVTHGKNLSGTSPERKKEIDPAANAQKKLDKKNRPRPLL